MKRLLWLGVVGLTGCASSPLLPSATSASPESAASTVSAPNSRDATGTPGSLIAVQSTSTSSGRPATVARTRMTIRLAAGLQSVDCQMIRPAAIAGVAQRYSNDCAQAALATTLAFLGANFAGQDPYLAISQKMVPTSWGTRLEDVQSYLSTHSELRVSPVRQATVAYLQARVAEGKPVPVVLSMSATSMHYTVVVGTGVSASGQGIVILKDPSLSDPGAVMGMDQATFEANWQNAPIRTLVVDWVAGLLSHTNTDNYDRVALDIGWPR